MVNDDNTTQLPRDVTQELAGRTVRMNNTEGDLFTRGLVRVTITDGDAEVSFVAPDDAVGDLGRFAPLAMRAVEFLGRVRAL